MQWDSATLRRNRRRERQREWHRWFSWYPIELTGESTWCWLEHVYRKRIDILGEDAWSYSKRI